MEDLRLEFEARVITWPDVTTKFMFGSLAYMVKGKLFAFLVIKEGDGLLIVEAIKKGE